MPAAFRQRSSNLPALPTKGWPARSSLSPGCSPTNRIAARSGPSPNTVCVALRNSGQAVHSAAASRSSSRLGLSGISAAALSVSSISAMAPLSGRDHRPFLKRTTTSDGTFPSRKCGLRAGPAHGRVPRTASPDGDFNADREQALSCYYTRPGYIPNEGRPVVAHYRVYVRYSDPHSSGGSSEERQWNIDRHRKRAAELEAMLGEKVEFVEVPYIDRAKSGFH